MSTSRAWSVAGLVAGFAGLAVSYSLAMVMTIRDAPLVAVAELVVRLTPGPVVERAIRFFGHHDKTMLLVVMLLISAAVFAWAMAAMMRRSRRSCPAGVSISMSSSRELEARMVAASSGSETVVVI